MLHRFPENISFELPDRFTDPFRYIPHESVKLAADLLIKHIDSDEQLATAFSEGKMLGILVCTKPSDPNTPYYLAAFSGNVGGKSLIDGFVPPIYDLMEPNGEFKRREAKISQINIRIRKITEDDSYIDLADRLTTALKKRDRDLENMRAEMERSKVERDRLRQTTDDESVQARLIRESQFKKAEFKRLKLSWEEKISQLRTSYETIKAEINLLTKSRAIMSDKLQRWIFQQYLVHNALGEITSIGELFAAQGLTPPGGTGECAAPKLMEYAYRNGLTPIAMGEFWYGKSPDTVVRTHGRFYPSCTSKCGPLLGYMLNGLQICKTSTTSDYADSGYDLAPIIIYEDDAIIAVDKPSGMPSVPGLDGRISLQEWLTERELAKAEGPNTVIQAVHRLDMDTSGVIIFAKTHQTAVDLRKQFEERLIKKTYMARLCPPHKYGGLTLSAGKIGSINLPLAPDYDERPRQKVDRVQGKYAYTDYEVTSVNTDGSIEVLLYPKTGRTHQLRVHCAHSLGLNQPIAGDLLYGGDSVQYNNPETGAKTSQNKVRRLCLHAYSITFSHPVTEESLTFTASEHHY